MHAIIVPEVLRRGHLDNVTVCACALLSPFVCMRSVTIMGIHILKYGITHLQSELLICDSCERPDCVADAAVVVARPGQTPQGRHQESHVEVLVSRLTRTTLANALAFTY